MSFGSFPYMPHHDPHSSPAQGQACSPPVPVLSPPFPGLGKQQAGAHLASRIPGPTLHCRRPLAHWCCWGAVPRPPSRLLAHCCHFSPGRETLCPTSSGTRAPRAAALTLPTRCLPLPSCLRQGGGSSPLLLEWSNLLPPAPATLGSTYKKTERLCTFFSRAQLIAASANRLSDVPLAPLSVSGRRGVFPCPRGYACCREARALLWRHLESSEARREGSPRLSRSPSPKQHRVQGPVQPTWRKTPRTSLWKVPAGARTGAQACRWVRAARGLAVGCWGAMPHAQA